MILINTTFVLHAPIEPDFLAWVKNIYLPAIESSGLFGTPTVARVETRIEPETESIAIQLPATDAGAAAQWLDKTAAPLHNSLHSRWGDRLMFFTTHLTPLEL